MKNPFACLCLLVIAVFLNEAGATPCYSPEALDKVIERAKIAESHGKHPVAIFDLDDTTIKTRGRGLRLATRLLNEPGMAQKYPNVAAAIKGLHPDDMEFAMGDTLKKEKVPDQEAKGFLAEFTPYFLSLFFNNEFEYEDKPNAGAAAYLKRLTANGIKVVYLTGRDHADMYEGTLANLKANGFPVSGTGKDDGKSLLIMKPSKNHPDGTPWPDLTFKTDTVKSADFQKLGEVVGSFENEPANENAIAKVFPNAISVLNDTIHDPSDKEIPLSGTFLIKDFKPGPAGNCPEQITTTQSNAAAGALQ